LLIKEPHLLVPDPAEVPDHDPPVSTTAGQNGFMLRAPPDLQAGKQPGKSTGDCHQHTADTAEVHAVRQQCALHTALTTEAKCHQSQCCICCSTDVCACTCARVMLPHLEHLL
jgi:hypothetical protein